MKKLDLTNKKFGRLKIIKEIFGRKRCSWECKCECGKVIVVTTSNLRGGHTKSCGCHRQEVVGKLMAQIHTTHGHTKKGKPTPEWVAWKSMLERCLCPTHAARANYRDRGITVYAPWITDFALFYAHIGDRPSTEHSLERIDNNKGYAPGNVKWATKVEQASNRRTNIFITYKGKTQTMKNWAREIGIGYQTLRSRLRIQNWPIEKAFTLPVDKRYSPKI